MVAGVAYPGKAIDAMYKWPQGKVIRMALLIIAVIAAVDCGLQCWGTTIAYLENPEAATWQQIPVAAIMGVLALGFLIGGIVAVGFLPKTVQWLIEVEQEMLKVTWPAQNEVVRSTIIIAIMTLILAAVIFLVDWLNIQVVVNLILRRS
jgi:preprotein translocase subunit SecE